MSDRRELDAFTSELDDLLGIEAPADPERERLSQELGTLASSDTLYVTAFLKAWTPSRPDELTESEARVFYALGDLGFHGAKDEVKTKSIRDVKDKGDTLVTSFRYGGKRVMGAERLLMMRKTYEAFNLEGVFKGRAQEILIFNAMATADQLRRDIRLRLVTIERFEEYAKWVA